MRRSLLICMIALGLSGFAVGCRDTPAPPPRVPVPAAGNRDVSTNYPSSEVKPLPPMEAPPENPPFNDVPLVSQQLPEEPAFVDAYRKVGSPRIVVFVNRTLEGDIASTVDQSSAQRGTNSRTRLRPGQYNPAAAQSIDYEAIETIMTDWLSCNGEVTIISPTMARQRLTDQQVQEIQQGRPQAMSEAVRQLGAEIFIQVQAYPTQQTRQGTVIRLNAEAMNVRGGESIARAVVDIPPPLEKTTINRYTRFLARKLIDGMLNTWSAPQPVESAPTPASLLPSTQPAQP